ncbi:hypothetical protein [Candidatus Nitrosocosmicus hydrocola]|uniref:hypothetical protein n=1 Tax=Candidatus Nitrosocosmicus hydrocola TaxID=1826872 RepID=UPI0011E602DD|nr:hypothetical protein [Candidatus Nitrosocosmicus hydrocola]
MTKSDIVQIMSKKTTKLALLSVVVVGMMVVLVPMIIEEVDARINAKAVSLAGPFEQSKVTLFAGKFWTSPRQPAPNVVTWETWGGPPFGGGSEIGRFTAQVRGDVISVDFSNPRFGGGPNTCTPSQNFIITVTCSISSGLYSSLTITVTPRVLQNDNGHCDMLDRLGDQSNSIRERLHC